MKKRVSLIAATLLVGLFASPARVGAGAPTSIADALFRDGQRLMKEGKLTEACASFRASLDADPALGTLLNLAVCNERLGKTATAWTQYAEVRTKAAQLGQAQRETFARERQAALESRLVRVVIEVAEPQAVMKLLIDGAELPAAAVGVALPLDPGEHVIEARAPAFKVFVKNLSLREGGKPMKVAIPPLELGEGLSEAAGASNVPAGFTVIPVGTGAGPAQVPDEVRPTSTRRLASWALLGGGAAGLVAAGAFGVRTLSLVSDRDARCPPGELCRDSEAMRLHDSASTSQTIGFVALGAGVAAAGAGAWLFFTEPSDSDGISLVPQAGPAQIGLSLGGAW